MGAPQLIWTRNVYEHAGWKDGRLGQAYDLVAEVLRERGGPKGILLWSIKQLDKPEDVA